MRWQTEKEAKDGKGQFQCGARKCDERDNLRKYIQLGRNRIDVKNIDIHKVLFYVELQIRNVASLKSEGS